MGKMVPLENNLPAEWQDKLAADAEATSNVVRPSSSFISLRSGILSYGGDPVANNELKVIVLGFAFERTMYALDGPDGELIEAGFDSDNPISPRCWGIMVPKSDEDKMETMLPMGGFPQAEACKDCRWDQWKSSLKGGRGKQCQERRRLVVVPEAALSSPDDMLTAEVALIKLPVTSSKQWDNYVSTLNAQFRRPPYAVVTKISTKPHAKNQFTVLFDAMGGVDPELLEAITTKRELAEVTLVNGYDDYEAPAEDAEPEKKGKKKY